MDSSDHASRNVIEGVDCRDDDSSDQQLSKIPRPLKHVDKRKSSKDSIDRPPSAKLVTNLEGKYKSSLVKFNKELSEMLSRKEKLLSIRESMVKIRDELEDKGQKGLPTLPDIPSLTQILPKELSKSHSKLFGSKMSFKKYRDIAKSEMIRESEEDICSKYNIEEGCIEDFASEVPSLEKKLDRIEDMLNKAHEKQITLESNLSMYQMDMNTIMDNLQEVESVKTNSQFLLQALDNLKDNYHSEKSLFNKQVSAKDEELTWLRKALEVEVSKRRALECSIEQSSSSKNLDKEQVDKPFFKSKSKIPGPAKSGYKESPNENKQLRENEEMLRSKLTSREQEIEMLNKEMEVKKEKIESLENNNNAVLSQLKNYCQHYIFDKENQIYSIKNRMHAIVNLKNEMLSREERGEPFISMDVVMSVNDADALKTEVVGLHKRMNQLEETGLELECTIKGKDLKIKELESEITSKYLELEMMEGVLETMKERQKENSRILAKIEFSSEMVLEEKHGDNDDSVRDLISCQNNQTAILVELEKKLKASEDRYLLAEERRIRNEERIALLQFKVAEFEH